MKISMLTFFKAINYGTFLQAYALQQTLLQLGYDVEVINYNAMSELAQNDLKNAAIGYLRHPIIACHKLLKKLRFDRAHRALRLTKPMSGSEVRSQPFEHVLIGSDEVWKVSHPAINDISLFFGKDLAAVQLSSYAASVGSDTDFENVPFDIAALLSRFNHLSVRDDNTKKMVAKFLGKEVPIHLDPTFLYEFNSETAPVKHRNFILIYSKTITEQPIINEIKSYGERLNKKIIAVGPIQPWADQNIHNAGPFEFLSMLKAADGVITSLHHGVVFAIHYNKPFCVLMNELIKNKVTPILNWLNLPNVYNQSGDIMFSLEKNVNWQQINSLVNKVREASIEYLRGLAS
ncbi:MAG TPA: polysaccharide pyruvyl transferase family protein [Bacillota bacterium]|jgi:hypothetical protein|nr:polysaccharide pyruvyl transferase family protein [Bacillota bacterium]HOL08764.1 polysaccharide pyruvyl transferase family protein [Bacillota bacterium]HPO96333.1 polysaccharide pyruvyl transferase family protein [Bacillota bacterium]